MYSKQCLNTGRRVYIDYNKQRKEGLFILPEVEKSMGKENKISAMPLLSAASQQAFQRVLKRGIYKELRKRRMLSDEQLTVLLNQCQRQE